GGCSVVVTGYGYGPSVVAPVVLRHPTPSEHPADRAGAASGRPPPPPATPPECHPSPSLRRRFAVASPSLRRRFAVASLRPLRQKVDGGAGRGMIASGIPTGGVHPVARTRAPASGSRRRAQRGAA